MIVLRPNEYIGTREGNRRLGDYTNTLDYYTLETLIPYLKCNANAISLHLESSWLILCTRLEKK